MQTVKMLRNLLAVKKLGKPSRRSGGDLFVETETGFNVGVIQLVGEELTGKFSPGQKVYFGNNREEIRMGSTEVLIMEEKNVFAIVEESADENPALENSETEA